MDYSLKSHHVMIIALMIIFIVFPVDIPHTISLFVSNSFVQILLYIFSLSLFWSHPLVGTISLVFIYELIKRSKHKQKTSQIQQYLPTTLNRDKRLNAINQFPTTLEEEIVASRLPQYPSIHSTPSYKPNLDTTTYSYEEI